MIVIYEKLTKKELKESKDGAIARITEWFEKNPKRRVCDAQLWYGQRHKIRRGHVADDINAVVKQTDTKD